MAGTVVARPFLRACRDEKRVVMVGRHTQHSARGGDSTIAKEQSFFVVGLLLVWVRSEPLSRKKNPSTGTPVPFPGPLSLVLPFPNRQDLVVAQSPVGLHCPSLFLSSRSSLLGLTLLSVILYLCFSFTSFPP